MIQKELHDLAKAGTVSKTSLKDVISKFDTAITNIPSNFAYLQKDFLKTMEDIVHDSKIEVETFMNNAAVRTGMQVTLDSKPYTLLVSDQE